MKEEKWHEHIGVYGIYTNEDSLLVVHKTRGPYVNRYDLPGGRLTNKESLEECLKREFLEEVGQAFTIHKQLGICNHLVPWAHEEFTHLHHVAVYYTVKPNEKLTIHSCIADDTDGYEMIPFSQLNKENASPLIMDAINYLKQHDIDFHMKRYEEWIIKAS